MTTSPRNNGGFTLVEMLMAMLVMTVGLLGLLQSVQIAYRQSLRDRVRDEAVLLAEEQMHDWRRGYKNISTVDKKIGGGEWRFIITRQSEQMGGGAGSARKLRLAITWIMRGETQRHEIYTLKTD